jgi:hypothetical protein
MYKEKDIKNILNILNFFNVDNVEIDSFFIDSIHNDKYFHIYYNDHRFFNEIRYSTTIKEANNIKKYLRKIKLQKIE